MRLSFEDAHKRQLLCIIINFRWLEYLPPHSFKWEITLRLISQLALIKLQCPSVIFDGYNDAAKKNHFFFFFF